MDNKNAFFDRKNPRWRGYDYSTCGVYFVTFCTHERKKLFSEIQYVYIDGIEFSAKVSLTPIGEIMQKCLMDIEKAYPGFLLDEYSIMPNHVHFIIVKKDPDSSLSISGIVGRLKSLATLKSQGLFEGKKLFQRSYFDRVIRNDDELKKIREYIINNPAKWAFDKYNSEGVK